MATFNLEAREGRSGGFGLDIVVSASVIYCESGREERGREEAAVQDVKWLLCACC